MKNIVLFWCMIGLLASCQSSGNENGRDDRGVEVSPYKKIGRIERLDPELDQLLDAKLQPEILAQGFGWTEGPVWVAQGSYLLFSDVINNKIYRWKESDSLQVYLDQSGTEGDTSRLGEPGSNGLAINRNGQLVICQHGDRRIVRMNSSLSNPAHDLVPLVSEYKGKRLNSPNDLVYMSNGDLYFTDPPYGLSNLTDSPEKELNFQGVYRLGAKDSSLHLLTKELSRPNGIAISTSGKNLYVANSDEDRALWMVYDIDHDGSISNGRIFYDATEDAKKANGLPDGLAIHSRGYIFATGPGGVWIFSPEGKHLGTILTEVKAANCKFDSSESSLYITATNYLLRVKLKANKNNSPGFQ